ncbi:MAG: CAP domain-containing protein, partial [Hyphomicrobium sp.]
MYRVALSAVLAASLGLGACSLNTGGPLATGYNDIDNTGSITPAGASVFSTSASTADRTSVDRTSRSGLSGTQVAALTPDKAPKGSFEKAPAGALSDRDYSHTALDAERARDLINQYRRDNGLKPLVLNASLTEAAKEHSR